ncbi:MAG: hypothetical protein NXI01_04750 [Gammaproteobacteria bacterium]|nr:hypothetical protein [Gammaproteobacteria bacterium]
MAVFHIDKPKAVEPSFFDYIVHIISLPWQFLKYVGNYYMGGVLGKLILQAQSTYEPVTNPDDVRNVLAEYPLDSHVETSTFYTAHDSVVTQTTAVLIPDKALTHKKHTIITHDDAELETLELNPVSLQKTPIEKQTYIINFLGNADIYQHYYDEMKCEAKLYNANIIGFNYRGVLNSKKAPQSQDDLITDGIAQVQRLLDTGVDPKKIILKGESLGAAIATMVAGYFHTHKQKINISNGRSFSTLTNEVVGQIRQTGAHEQKGHTETKKGIFLGYLLMPLIKLILHLGQWDMQPVKAYKQIDEENKMYYLVRSPKSLREQGCIDDHVIPHYASLHKGLEKSERKKESKCKNRDRNNAHCQPSHRLVNKDKVTALQMFGLFVKKVQSRNPNSNVPKPDQGIQKSL